MVKFNDTQDNITEARPASQVIIPPNPFISQNTAELTNQSQTPFYAHTILDESSSEFF
uniref:Uncharacterized protein n=1 Tax=Rhizophagus irregularis (strain DAOM 181602 / DAOM 197198 / MUCL 43194) TaxID=747089 RepID=U9V0Z9_RHIID